MSYRIPYKNQHGEPAHAPIPIHLLYIDKQPPFIEEEWLLLAVS
jgi:hypothetical protein